ncbi:radical SAM protein [Candidatus Saganbacteria bacterium]|nr:radical SAM protein [Candidatus Saganbacteria bacterium]
MRPDIVYLIGNSLYLNITNRCTNECGFCIRNVSPKFNQKHNLWFDHEPTAEEVIAAIGDPTHYDQIVFCGYGEPTIRLDLIKAVAAELKSEIRNPKSEKKTIIRLNTNGQANFFWGRNILPELKGLIDAVTISLNATSNENYVQRCNPEFGDKAFPAVIDFIKKSKKYIPQVEISAVDLPDVDRLACEKLAQDIGVKLRLRPYYEDKYVK